MPCAGRNGRLCVCRDEDVKPLCAADKSLAYGDPDGNPVNFQGATQVAQEPTELFMYQGLRVMLTKNINKDVDVVNGMGGVVEGVHGHEVKSVMPWPLQRSPTKWRDSQDIRFNPRVPLITLDSQ